MVGKISNFLLFLSAREKTIMHCSPPCTEQGGLVLLQRSFALAGTLYPPDGPAVAIGARPPVFV